MITSINQFRLLYENNQHKQYIYIGHGQDEGVVEFWAGHEYWNHDANTSCPMGWDILHSLGNTKFPMSMNIEQVRDQLGDMFQYAEVISKDEIPAYCKGYEPQPKDITWPNVRACYNEIQKFVQMDDKHWKMFVRDFEKEIIYLRINNLDMNQLCQQFYYCLQPYVQMNKIGMFMYKDLCDVIDKQFEPEKP